jgi:hypothetical protein
MAFTSGLKDANGSMNELSKNGELQEWGHNLAATFVGVANAIDNILNGAKMAGTWLAHQSAGTDINAKYAKKKAEAPEMATLAGQLQQSEMIERQRKAELAKEQESYEAAQVALGAAADRFQRAFDERTAAQTAKHKAAAEARLKVDQDYAAKATALVIANADKSIAVQQSAQAALAKSVYVGTPTYRDTEGRDPKPKADQVENTELADTIKRFDNEFVAAKKHYDDLSKLDDMYHKAGELSDVDFYGNKRSYADASAAAQIAAYGKEITALKSHHNSTEAEAAKHEKQLHDIEDKRAAAVAANAAEQFRLDEEERLRAKKIQSDSDDAMGKYLSSLQKEAQKLEDSNRGREESRGAVERLTAARLDEAAATTAQTIAAAAENGEGEATIEMYQRLIIELQNQAKAHREIAAALDQQDVDKANKKAAEKASREWDKTAHHIQDTLADAIMNGGANAWKKLKTAIASQVLSVPLQYISSVGASILNPGATQAGGVMGASGGASQIGGIVQAGKSLYDAIGTGFTGLASSIGTGFVNLGGALGSSGLQAFGAGFGSTGMIGASDAAGLYAAAGGTGSSAAVTAGAYSGAAVTAAAGIAAGVLGGNLISGQYGSKNTVYAGAAAGAAIGSIVPVIGTAIGALVGGIIGGIGNRLFGMGDKKLGATGIRGELSPDSFVGENYAKWTQKGGLFRSDKEGTDTSPVDGTQAGAFTSAYKSILGMSALFGHTIGEDVTRLSTRVQALNIDLTGLTTDADRLAAVTKFFEGVGNTIATEIVPNLASFQKEGEALSATLQRVANDYAGIDGALASIGKSFGAVGASSIAAREQLLAATGGLSALAQGTDYFRQNFLSAAEQLAPAQKQLTEQLVSMGLANVTTVDQFKATVLGLDLTSESGADLYAKLIALAPAFKSVSDATDAVQADILSQRKDLQQQYDELTKTSVQLLAEQRDALDASNRSLFDQVQAVKAARAAQDAAKSALQGVIDKTATFGASMKQLRGDLLGGDMSILNPMDKYKQARAEYDKDLALARGGDTDAQSKLAGLATAFLNASKTVNASGSDYTSDFIKVQREAEEAAKWASQQVDIGQATLDAYNKSIGVLSDINAGVASVDAAIRALVDAGGFMKVAGSHATGLTHVPYDEYPMVAHKGEAVIDAPAMSAMRRYFGGAPSMGGSSGADRAEIAGLRAEVAGLRADLVKHTGALIQQNHIATDRAAEKINAGAKRSATETTWKQQSKPGVPT